MTGILSWDFVLGLVSFLLTLMVLSYLIGDNPAFRVAVYLFIGVSAGYAASVAFWQVLWPKLVLPLLSGSWVARVLLVFPLIMGGLLLMKLSARTARLGSASLAFMTGVGAAVAIGGAVVGTILPQAQAAINVFDLSNSGGLWLERIVDALVMLVGTVATLAYFHFGAKAGASAPERGKLIRAVGWVGQVFIAGTFGVLFAGVLTAALTAFIERWSSLITFLSQYL
jgi:hypothetical protein